MKFTVLISLMSYCTSMTIAESNFDNEDLKLELVQVLFRHGARTPKKSEIDVYNFTPQSSYESFGLGQLTTKGKQQEYQFGQFLRSRYNSFLGPHYKPKDVYAFASTADRTQMSLQLVLAGLYPLKDSAAWNPKLNWSPIPYVTAPKKLNILLESHKSSKFKRLRKRALKSKEFQRRLASFSDFIKSVKEKTNVRDNDLRAIIDSTFDVLTANEHMNLSVPDWYTWEVKQQFLDVDDIIRDAYVATPELRKSGPGPLIKTFVQNMNLEENVNNPRKIYLYAGHNTNIGMFTRAHRVNEFRYPSFGSAVILEKLRNKKNRVYVRLLGWNGSGSLTTLKLASHEKFCPIEDYLKIVEDVMPSNEEIDDMLADLSAKKIRKIFFKDDQVTKANE
ncbi:venom acid phosphatase Acph-1-like [Phymastichus coffea]|uniref:venom acid phosphatase Acph-1-like n=1 Tax=Phymastichus coffea TaxID=108790 RepID=UPI00273AB33C|nr:venom acid phosphatase Acph-1-like [Phymastichus coffea]